MKEKFHKVCKKKKVPVYSYVLHFEWKEKRHTTALFSFAPLTSCDTEESFSMLKNRLSEGRRTFPFDNLRVNIVVQYNAPFNHLGGGSS